MTEPPRQNAMIHVCSLAALETVVAGVGATHIVTVINPWSIPQTPTSINPDNHLKLVVNDIDEPQPGLIAPEADHINMLLDFVRRWNCNGPLVIHCLAGISRSSAAAFISVCALNPRIDEMKIAQNLRNASHYATPNLRMIQLADSILERDGRMYDAICGIGRGQPTMAGEPFLVATSMS